MTLGTPALLFGAIALILLAYTNRFFLLARLIRDMHSGKTGDNKSLDLKQVPILRRRLKLIQYMQALGVSSFFLCTLSMFALFVRYDWLGHIIFGISVIALMLSLLCSLWEVLLSKKALDMVLDDFDAKHGS